MRDAGSTLQVFVAGFRRRERVRRVLAASVVTIAVVCVVAIAPSVFAWAGASLPWRWSSAELGLAAMIVTSATVMVAALVPVQVDRLLRSVDHRLGLDEALITAHQVRGASEPIHRLLVRRTVARLEHAPMRRAVPLRIPWISVLVPALAIVAVGLSAQPPAASSVAGSLDARPDPDAVELSNELRDLLAEHAAATKPAPSHQAELLQQLLEIDAAVRGVEITPTEARAALREVLDSWHKDAEDRGENPGTVSGIVGSDSTNLLPQASFESLVAALEKLTAGPGAPERDVPPGSSPASGQPEGEAGDRPANAHSVSIGASGDRAGLGAAPLERSPTTRTGEGPSLGSGIRWELPFAGSTSDWRVDAGSGVHSRATDRFAPRAGSRSLFRLDLPLTSEERFLVEEYFRTLQRMPGERSARPPGGKPGGGW